MKILQIIPQLSSGGGERFTVDLCNELAERGHEVVLCVLHSLDNENNSFYLPQVSKKVRVVSLNKKSGFDISLFWKIYKFAKEEKPDVIHTHLRGILYALLAERFVVHGVHTVHNEASIEASEWLSRSTRKYLFNGGYSQPVTISEVSRRSFVDFYKMDAPMIFNGRNIPANLQVSEEVKAECNSYRKNEKTRLIVHLAHLDNVKRQLLHTRVAKRLQNEGYNLGVLFIGSQRDSEYVEQVKAEMPECCHLLGQRTNPLEYLKESGAFALSSLYEGLPISLIEALGVGAIPICTPVGGIVDLVKDGENGFLSADLEEESFYQAEKRFLEMRDEELEQMRKKAFESYAPFSMTECATKYEEVYKKVIDKKRQ